MLKIFSIIVLVCFNSSLVANPNEQDFLDAARAYQAGDFSEAIKLYESSYKNGHINGSLLFNLGNSYFKDGQLGMAIGSYLKSLTLIPRDADLKANLMHALSKTKDKQAFNQDKGLQWWLLGSLVNMKELLYGTIILWLAGCASLALSFWSESWTRSLKALGSLLALLGVLGFSALVIRDQSHARIGAVVVEEANVFASPSSQNSIAIFKLHEGAIIKMVKTELDWVAVEFSDQQRGWLPAEQVRFF